MIKYKQMLLTQQKCRVILSLVKHIDWF